MSNTITRSSARFIVFAPKLDHETIVSQEFYGMTLEEALSQAQKGMTEEIKLVGAVEVAIARVRDEKGAIPQAKRKYMYKRIK